MLRQNKEVRDLIAVLFHYSKSVRTNDVIFFLSFFFLSISLSLLIYKKTQYIQKSNQTVFKSKWITIEKKQHLTLDGKLVAKIEASND